MEYVHQGEAFARQLLPESVRPFLLVDAPASDQLPPRLLTEAYRPDLYLFNGEWHLIGEAKTDKDCMRPHSLEQYKTYLEELESFNRKESYLIMSCSMQMSPAMSNLFRRLKRENQYSSKIIIINELGLYRKI